MQRASGSDWREKFTQGMYLLGKINDASQKFTGKSVGALIGGAVLTAAGSLVAHKVRKKHLQHVSHAVASKHMSKHFRNHVKQALEQAKHHVGNPSNITGKHVNQFLAEHGQNELGAKDVFGRAWKSKGNQLNKVIQYAPQFEPMDTGFDGSGVFQDIKKGAKKLGHTITHTKAYKDATHVRNQAVSKLKDFAAGRTKLKPSALAKYLSTAVSVVTAASSIVPGLDFLTIPAGGAIATGLSVGSQALKMSGRGIKIPPRILKYIQNYPAAAKLVAKKVKMHGGAYKMTGSGKGSRFAAALGIASTSAGLGAYGFYQWLLRNPSQAALIVSKGSAKIAGSWLAGSGLKMTGDGRGNRLRPPNPFIKNTVNNKLPPFPKNDTEWRKYWKNHQRELRSMSNLPTPIGIYKQKGGCKCRQKGNGLLLSGHGKVKAIGSKREVWNGLADHTSGNLTRDDLMKNKRGKIVSKKQHAAGKRAFSQNKLQQYVKKDFNK